MDAVKDYNGRKIANGEMPDPYKLDEMRQSMENQMKSITESLEWRKEEFEARINSYLAYQNKLNGTE